MFAEYQSDFERFEGQISDRLTAASSNNDIESNDAAALQQLINQAESCVRQMEVEIRTMPNRNALAIHIKTYQDRCRAMKRQTAGMLENARRSELLSGGSVNQQTRDRMLSTTRTLQDVRLLLYFILLSNLILSFIVRDRIDWEMRSEQRWKRKMLAWA